MRPRCETTNERAGKFSGALVAQESRGAARARIGACVGQAGGHAGEGRGDRPGARADAESKLVASSQPAEASPKPAAPKPEFDLASLPSLESITATTDIRAFLSPGVPQELTRAALRRAWLADPAIRDFVGLQENDWDFTNPDAIPGFGDLPAGTDIKKMVADIFGDVGKPTEDAPAREKAAAIPSESQSPAAMEETPRTETAGVASQDSERSDRVPPEALPDAPPDQTEPPATEIVQRNNNTATQQSGDEVSAKESGRRPQHGGALPKV
jgi:hypothetical protein